jgi:alkylhydroperoxidase/carboxymuconolactone decarboxylase family protein YurZ
LFIEEFIGIKMNNEIGNTSKGYGLQKLANELGGDVQRLFVFFSLFENALDEGALTSKIKQLIAMAMAIGFRSSEGITYHVDAALQAGASRDEIREAVTVAVLFTGVRSILSGAEALAAVGRFEAQKQTSSGISPDS